MTPFPETELVTLDRLEVALRDKNLNLLKEGSYKLHEKYHSGHNFENLDKIKSIYLNVIDDMSVPNDIKDILCPTIEDILADNGIEVNSSDSSLSQNRVSSLTQLSYNASAPQGNTMVEESAKPEGKISAFDVFGASKKPENNSYVQSPFNNDNNAPFQEFKMPEAQTGVNETMNNRTMSQNVSMEMNIDTTVPEVKQESIFEQPVNDFSEPVDTLNDTVPFGDLQIKPESKLEDVAVFYCQDVSNEKVKNILRYRELISKLQEEHHSINEILYLISEINIQSNTNILELKGILDQLRINKNNVNLVTNSTSAHLIGLMEQGEYSYSLYGSDEDKQINLVPVFGLSNQFICPTCGEIYLDKEDKINPLVLQCPKCKSPMFPNFYTANNQDIQMNLDYYNTALLSLVNSDVWVIIHPVLEDRVMTNMILSAVKLTSSLKKVYILDKDINIREELKRRFLQSKYNIEVNTNVSALEDFLNSIR